MFFFLKIYKGHNRVKRRYIEALKKIVWPDRRKTFFFLNIRKWLVPYLRIAAKVLLYLSVTFTPNIQGDYLSSRLTATIFYVKSFLFLVCIIIALTV